MISIAGVYVVSRNFTNSFFTSFISFILINCDCRCRIERQLAQRKLPDVEKFQKDLNGLIYTYIYIGVRQAY